eukprot:2231877-Rhodomonas_salina.1
MYGLLGRALHRAQDSTARCLASVLLLAPVALGYAAIRCVVAEWHCYDYQGAYEGQETRAPFLWVCESLEEAEDERDAEAGRMQILTQRFEHSFNKALAEQDNRRKQDHARLETTLALLMDKLSALADQHHPDPRPRPAARPAIPELKGGLSEAVVGRGSVNGEAVKQNGHGGHGAGACKCPFSGAI